MAKKSKKKHSSLLTGFVLGSLSAVAGAAALLALVDIPDAAYDNMKTANKSLTAMFRRLRDSKKEASE